MEQEDQSDAMTKRKKKKKGMKVVVLCMIVTSLCGGLILTWWLYKYHPRNSHLWMVPPGLVLFLTPIVVSTFLIFSHVCEDSHGPER